MEEILQQLFTQILALAERVIIEALAAVPRVAETPAPDVLVVGMSALATDLEVRLWVKDAVNTVALTLNEAMRAIRDALRRNDIALAMPEWFAVRERATKLSGK